MSSTTYECDFLVIGSGIAGLTFALKVAQEGTVHIITKKAKAESNTNYAQGGIAAVWDPEDSFEQHIQDTLAAGAGLCHPDAVELIVRNGPERVNELMKWGVKFSTTPNGRLDLGREGGHRRNRIIHATDLTGREVEQALLNSVKENKNIRIFENHMAVELITEHHLQNKQTRPKQQPIHCWGAYVLDVEADQVKTFLSRTVLLATGGCGHVYLHTTNPSIATGDGIAMAYRAGAWVGNLEFMQFHPTTLFYPGANSFLISEAVRGFGGILRNSEGEAFMANYHPMKDLASRDIVARAIDAELKRSGADCVYLDVTHLDPNEVKSHFPHIYEKCLELGLDITAQPIPVVPAAHYMCGGVVTNLRARTSICGLYAAGEVAFTGVHGANRLASNSLLEALVFGNIAAKDAKNYRRNVDVPRNQIPSWSTEGTFNAEEWVLVAHDRGEIQTLMWDYVGIVRSNLRLQRAERRVRLVAEEIEDFYKRTKITEGLLELRNLSCVAQLMIAASRFRRESRGLHYNTDYPEPDDRYWKHDTFIHRDLGIQIALPAKIVWDDE